MDNATIEKLYEDFDVAIKPGQGFKYVRTRDILDRLNKTFAGNWGVQVKHHEMIGEEVLVLVSVHLYDDDGHIKATQEGFGSAKKFRNTEMGNIYKSATSKAVKSAVRNWGVALFLDEDTQGTDTGRSDSSMPNMSNTPQSMPSAMPSAMPTSSMPSSVPNAMPDAAPSGTPSGMPQSSNPAPPDTSAPPTGSTPISMPPTNAGNVPPPPEAQAVPDNVPQPPSGSLPSMTAVPGGPPPSMQVGEEIHAITNVQKVAITSRLGAKGLSFDQISEEFYSGKASQAPDNIDGMLYTDALDMVAFLNNK